MDLALAVSTRGQGVRRMFSMANPVESDRFSKLDVGGRIGRLRKCRASVKKPDLATRLREREVGFEIAQSSADSAPHWGTKEPGSSKIAGRGRGRGGVGGTPAVNG